jgi:hypothetical protein
MSPRQLLPFVGGLDRARGAAVADSRDYSDLRNALMLDGSLRVRPGIGSSIRAISGATDICYITVFQSIARVIAVTYDSGSRDVDVWSLDLQGNDPISVGTWGTLAGDAATPPMFSSAESYNILVLAHDEEVVTNRLDTMRFDPASIGNPFDTIDADLDGNGAVPVQFRWVTTHFGYVFAGGYGSPSEPRSDIVRQSSPVDPTIYEPNRYVAVGTRDDPVLGGVSHRGTFIVGKGQSTWAIRGTTSADFAPALIDPRIGWVNHRAQWSQDGMLYFMSSAGPMVTDGSTMVIPAGLELDLPSLYPVGVPAEGPPRHMFAFGLPDDRHIVFACPNPEATRMRAYVLSIRREGEKRWGIWTLPTMLHGSLVLSGISSSVVDPGYADPVTTTGSQGLGDASIEVVVTHNDVVGDETIEVWYKPDLGVWGLLTQVPVNTSGPTQTISFTGAPLVSGDYEVQVRYKRQGGRVLASYSDPDPDMWPNDSLAAGTVLVVGTPTAVTLSYDFTTGDVTVGWTNGDPTQDLDVEVEYPAPGSGTRVTSAKSVAAGNTSEVWAWAAASPQNYARVWGLDPLNAYRDITMAAQYQVPPTLRARARHKVGATLGAWSAWSTFHSITYDGAVDGANVNWASSNRSVALGTALSFSGDLPTGRVGDTVVYFAAVQSTYGASPGNGSCGTVNLSGAWALPPVSAPVILATRTFPDTDPDAFATGMIALPTCATCTIPGQLIQVGLIRVVMAWTKAGDFADHGARFDIAVTASSASSWICTA